MITMVMFAKIRRMHFREYLTISEIQRRTSLSRNTIKKWLKGDEDPTIELVYIHSVDAVLQSIVPSLYTADRITVAITWTVFVRYRQFPLHISHLHILPHLPSFRYRENCIQ